MDIPAIIQRVQDNNFTPIPPVKGYKPTRRPVMPPLEEPITAPLNRKKGRSLVETLKALPGEALNDMAAYEQVNPLGSALSFMGNVVAGKGARGFKQAEVAGRTFTGAVDQLPRFEIDDSAAVLEGLPKAFQDGKVGDYLNHPELLDNYLEAKDINLRKKINGLNNSSEAGSFDPKTNTITVDSQNENPLSVLLHELQHWIQGKEGFAKGGSPTDFIDTNIEAKLDKLAEGLSSEYGPNVTNWPADKRSEWANLLSQFRNRKQGIYDNYQNLAGEVESRNVQGRMKMTPQERQAKPFNDTFDVPADQQILRKQKSLAELLQKMQS